MIVEGLLSVFKAFFTFVVGLFPTDNPPGWLSSGSAALGQVWNAAAGLGAWIPWATATQVCAAVMACLLAGLGIKLVRMVLSLFTGGGGSAA